MCGFVWLWGACTNVVSLFSSRIWPIFEFFWPISLITFVQAPVDEGVAVAVAVDVGVVALAVVFAVIFAVLVVVIVISV